MDRINEIIYQTCNIEDKIMREESINFILKILNNLKFNNLKFNNKN